MRYVPDNLVVGSMVDPIPAARFEVNVAGRDWVNRQCTAQPLGCWEQPIHLTANAFPSEDTVYICATGRTGGTGRFLAQFERAKSLGWKTFTIPSGHDVMLDDPETLTDLLLGC